MYKCFIFLAVLFCFQQDSKGVAWNENFKLNWQDFKAKPDKSTDAVAITASGITFGYSVQRSSTRGIIGFKSEVFAHFYPEHSWYKKESVDSHVLAHEQLHFDITELNARYFREKLSKLKVNSKITEALNALHNQTNTSLADMQNKYDTESNYSMDNEGQAKWTAFVAKELKRLQKFKVD